MAVDSNELLGQSLGACTLQRLLGRGGMSTVYLAQQSRPRRAVAVKVLMPTTSSLQPQSKNEFLARFRREADAIATLDHIHITPIYEYGEQGDLAYLVMPHITGGTLRELMQQRGILPISETLAIIEQASTALDYAHAQRIIHRDLKPSNILFHADRRVLLADFGLAKVLRGGTETGQEGSATLTSEGTIIGTPEYLSPEQATGYPLDQRTDIYSLGVVLFQMLTGHVPFFGGTPIAIAIKHTHEEPPSLCQLNPQISHAIEDVVLKALAKRPEDRYMHAGDLAHAFHTAVFEQHVPRVSPALLVTPEATVKRIVPPTLINNTTVPVTTTDSLVHDLPTTVSPPMSPFRWQMQQANSTPHTPYHPQRAQQPSKNRSWGIILATSVLILLACISGIAFYILPQQQQAQRGGRRGSITSSQTTEPSVPLPQALISPVGNRLYGTSLSGSACNALNTQWKRSSNAQGTCGTTATEVNNSGTESGHLAGVYLSTLPPNNTSIPNSYVVQAQVDPRSSGTFGISFRNQNQNQGGGFAFLLDHAGNWSSNAYTSTGQVKQTFVQDHIYTSAASDGTITIDVIIQGSGFTLYVNGAKQGSADAVVAIYPSGSLGLVADTGGDVFFKNVEIYSLPN